MKTTLELPNDLVREIKLRAVNEGKKLKDVIAELLRKGLGESSAPVEEATPRKGRIILPLFPSGPNAPAARMTAEELTAAEYEALTEDDFEHASPSA